MLVAYAEGGAPTCPTCAYPGADVRWQQVPPASGLSGPGAGWAAPASLAQPVRTSGKAVTSMILGIASIVVYPLSFILGIIALVLGVMARKEIRASDGTIGGNGMAVAGIVLGIVGTVVVGFIVLAAIVFVLVADLGEGAAAAVGALGR